MVTIWEEKTKKFGVRAKLFRSISYSFPLVFIGSFYTPDKEAVPGWMR